jgi:hypothetical protein
MPRSPKSKKTAPASAPKKSAAKKPPLKPATREEETLDYARAIALAVKAQMPAIQKHPVGKKLLTAARLAQFNKDISAASTAMTSHQLQKVSAQGATANEAKLRKALIDQVTTVRDAVSALPGVDKETARAFGKGAQLKRETNAGALLLAAQQQQAFANAKYSAAAADAGITAAQITAIMVARRALSNAASAQATTQTSKKGQGIDKNALIRALAKETTSLRKVAAIVFKNTPKTLTNFAPAPKKRVAKRKPKTPSAPPTSATPPSNGTTGAAIAAKPLTS